MAKAARPVGIVPAGLLLAPGASDRDQPGLVAVEDALVPKGFPVERIDFPYVLAGRRAPDRQPVLLDAVEGATKEFAHRLGVEPAQIILGGRSMGGRIASMLAASLGPFAGLVALSYPLHPPGRPDRLRTEHFAGLALPCLFVSGSRDAFGSPAELKSATELIPGPVELVIIEGGDHGMRRFDGDVAAVVADWVGRRQEGKPLRIPPRPSAHEES